MTTKAEFEDGNLVVTRIYDASVEAVFEAWIETSKVQQWWGCAECTSVSSEIEPKVGGKYNHNMAIEGAGEVQELAILIEYDPPNKLAFSSQKTGLSMLVTVEFNEIEGGTSVRLVHTGIPNMRVQGDIELREIIRSGWTAAFGKLAKLFMVTT
ncbi:MAG: SRPBCC domain-containing protein [Planctomycetota bacterium]